jgi:two-component sensor histidine kinase
MVDGAIPSGHERLLLHVVDGINRTLKLKEVLRKCMEAAKTVMHAEASSLMLLDELTGDLNVSVPTGPVKDEIIGMAVPKSKGIGGWVISYNQPFISNDVIESDVFWKDLSTGFTTRNIICVPLRNPEGQAFGVLQAINKKGNTSFENEEVPVFEALALHVATAIERSKKYDKMAEKLEAREEQLRATHHQFEQRLSLVNAPLKHDLEEAEDTTAVNSLSATNSRIQSLIDAHSLLAQQQEADVIELSKYLAKVVQASQAFYVHTRFEEIHLNANKGILCGLLLNEFLLDAFMCDYSNVEEKEIAVSLHQPEENRMVLTLSNNGVRRDKKAVAKGEHTESKNMIQALVSKLKGEISYKDAPGEGATCVFRMPI